jgi:predicted methyltransferase
MLRQFLPIAVLLIAAPAFALTPPEKSALAAAVTNPGRTPANVARDNYRHPAQTLAFFGVTPTQSVIEITPSGGWYTEILAPYLAAHGSYTAAGPDPKSSPGAAASVVKFNEKLAADPKLYGKVKIAEFTKTGLNTPAGTADVVLTFRNIHNMYIGGFAPAAFAAFYTALKPGGTLGIVEHRLPESMPDAMQDNSGYMKTSTVVKLAEAAGFKLAAKSEINANPKDTHDHPKGVWTLPPTYELGDTDKAKYAAIGESDRMTLRFVKPK